MTTQSDFTQTIVFKKQADKDTKATASGAQTLRRVSTSINLSKNTFQSSEILESQQIRDMRHGQKVGAGDISGELSPGTYQEPIASAIRGTYTSAPTAASMGMDVVSGVFTRTSGSYISDGFYVGQVVRFTALAQVDNNANNLVILALTATALTGQFINGTTIVDEASGTGIGLAGVGKHVFTPQTGQARDWYTVQLDYPDLNLSEQAKGLVFTGFNIGVTPDGMVTVTLPTMFIDQDESAGPYFTSPTASTSTGITAGPSGLIFINGTQQVAVSSLSDLTLAGGHTPIGVIGSNIAPDIIPGSVVVTGTLSAYFENATLRDLFLNETEVPIFIILPISTANDADFVVLMMPRCKFTDASKSVADNALQQNMSFQALENTVTAGGLPIGTVVYQDSQAV